MEAAQKTLQIQAQVRHNAEDYKNNLNDLYNWEKEIKDKEKQMQNSAKEEKTLKSMPVRSHQEKEVEDLKANACKPMEVKQVSFKQPVVNGNKTTTPTNGAIKASDLRVDTEDGLYNYKLAQEIKDKGNQKVKLGDYKNAIDDYTEAISILPNNAIFYSNRALCQLKLERYHEAIEDCDKAIEIDNLATKAYYRRMQANESLGNNMEALKDCTTVLIIDPKNVEAKRSLQRINDRLRKFVKSPNGPNFSPLRDDMIDILPIDKPAYKRSTVPLHRVAIADVVGPKDTKNYENSNLQISDEDIDKLFNSNCGNFVEIKKDSSKVTNAETKPIVQTTVSKTTANNSSSELKQENNKKKSLTPETLITKVNKTESLKLIEATKINKAEASTKPTVKPSEDSNKKVSTCKPQTNELKILETINNNNTQRPLPPMPTSTAQFYSNWKELTSEQKYKYLKSIELTKLCNILGAGFDSDTLTDVLRTIQQHYVGNKQETVTNIAHTLLQISRNNQVTILSLLMSSEERKLLSEIINCIKGNVDEKLIAEINRNFNLH